MKAEEVRNFAKSAVGQAVEMVGKNDIGGAHMKLQAANIFLVGETIATMKEQTEVLERIAISLAKFHAPITDRLQNQKPRPVE